MSEVKFLNNQKDWKYKLKSSATTMVGAYIGFFLATLAINIGSLEKVVHSVSVDTIGTATVVAFFMTVGRLIAFASLKATIPTLITFLAQHKSAK